MKKWYIINIDFESPKYGEEGTLTYKTQAESREEAEQKAENFIKEEIKKDKSYNYIVALILDLNSLIDI